MLQCSNCTRCDDKRAVGVCVGGKTDSGTTGVLLACTTCHTVHRRYRSGTLIIVNDDVLINVYEMSNCDAKVCSSRRFVVSSRRLTAFYSRGPSIIWYTYVVHHNDYFVSANWNRCVIGLDNGAIFLDALMIAYYCKSRLHSVIILISL